MPRKQPERPQKPAKPAKPTKPERPTRSRARAVPPEGALNRAGDRRGMTLRERLNLELGGGAQPGSGRPPREFVDYIDALLEDELVQDAAYAVLTDSGNRNYAATLKTVLGYKYGTPVQRVQKQMTHRFVAYLPPKSASPEAWAEEHRPGVARLLPPEEAEGAEDAGAGEIEG